MTGFFTEPAEQRILAELANLRADVKALQGGVVRVPIREADPPPQSTVTLWMMVDGRLRGRKPDGTIIEYAFSDHLHDDRYALITAPQPPAPPPPDIGGGTSTEPPPPPPYVPSTHEYRSGGDWAQCYWKGGSEVYANAGGRLYYSMYTSSTGQLKSMIHFPGVQSALAPGPAGTQIAEVHLRINNQHTYSNAGGSLRIGLHSQDGMPGNFSEVIGIGQVPVGKPSNSWYQLPNWVGEAFRDGSVKGFTYNQESTNKALYGYASQDAELRIVFVK